MARFLPTKYTGVQYYESKNGKDKYFYISYRDKSNGNKHIREEVGWQSEGYTAVQALEISKERI